MFEVFKDRILRLLQHRDYHPLKPGKLAKVMGVDEEEYPEFKKAVEDLKQAGHIVIGQRNTITLPVPSGSVTGKFKAHPKGFGFVIPEGTLNGDLFIPPGRTEGAMTGDTVKAKVIKSKKPGKNQKFEGEILEILQRGEKKVVGTLLKRREGWFVLPDGKNFTDPIKVEDVSAKNAKPRDKVVVEILSYPEPAVYAKGVITEVIGKRGKYESEIQSIIHQFHIRNKFDEDCKKQAHSLAENFKAEKEKHREDATDKFIITIDPEDAKDFDDAISLEENPDGSTTLGIHIADVSRFVRKGSALDIEAKKRGNSTYLPGRTIPMLPEVISNGICSLQPEEKRYCKSVYIKFDKDANVISTDFANSIICSNHRLNYKQADAILKGNHKGYDKDLVEFLKLMEKLARRIEKRRYKAGMLHLELPEMEIIMDDSGKVVDAEPADESYPHTIIEMFMVSANTAVAALFSRQNQECMRRIHPSPDALNLKQLSKLIRSLGMNFPKKANRKDIQSLLEDVKGTEYERAVNLMVLRSFEKAVYSPLTVGHYALALEHYCHFTSPIRRYADLMIHRQLENFITGESKTENPGKEELIQTGEHISFTERNSESAENELKNVLILQMLNGRLGYELKCIITGITSFGVFLQCSKYGVEGLIKIENLGEDYWQVNEKKHIIVGKRSGVELRLGQPMNAKILSVDIPARKLELSPAQPLTRRGKKKNKNKSKKKNKGKKGKK